MHFLLNRKHLPNVLKDHWRDMMLATAICLDIIWYVRNKVVHEQDISPPNALIDEVIRRYDAHQFAWASRGHDKEKLEASRFWSVEDQQRSGCCGG